MTASISPVVRHLIVCEGVAKDPRNTRRISLLNLIYSIRSLEKPPYPLRYRPFCVFLELTGGRGTGEVRVEIREADTDATILATRARSVMFQGDPLVLFGLKFGVRDCLFPAPGLYWVQFWYNNVVLSQQPIVLR